MNIQGWFSSGLASLISLQPRDSQESSPAPQFESINSLMLSLLYSPTFTSINDYWKVIAFSLLTFNMINGILGISSTFYFLLTVRHIFHVFFIYFHWKETLFQHFFRILFWFIHSDFKCSFYTACSRYYVIMHNFSVYWWCHFIISSIETFSTFTFLSFQFLYYNYFKYFLLYTFKITSDVL